MVGCSLLIACPAALAQCLPAPTRALHPPQLLHVCQCPSQHTALTGLPAPTQAGPGLTLYTESPPRFCWGLNTELLPEYLETRGGMWCQCVGWEGTKAAFTYTQPAQRFPPAGCRHSHGPEMSSRHSFLFSAGSSDKPLLLSKAPKQISSSLEQQASETLHTS